MKIPHYSPRDRRTLQTRFFLSIAPLPVYLGYKRESLTCLLMFVNKWAKSEKRKTIQFYLTLFSLPLCLYLLKSYFHFDFCFNEGDKGRNIKTPFHLCFLIHSCIIYSWYKHFCCGKKLSNFY